MAESGRYNIADEPSRPGDGQAAQQCASAMDRDRFGKIHKDRRGYRRPPSPQIEEKCWTDEDLEFFLTGDYDMSEESVEIQIMLDLAPELTAARVEWLMEQSRRESTSQGNVESYREPRHVGKMRPSRGGYDVGHE